MTLCEHMIILPSHSAIDYGLVQLDNIVTNNLMYVHTYTLQFTYFHRIFKSALQIYLSSWFFLNKDIMVKILLEKRPIFKISKKFYCIPSSEIS